MVMFLKPADLEVGEVKPFDSFPLALQEGSLSGFVFTDGLAETVFTHHLIASALERGPVYHLGPGGLLSIGHLRKMVDDLSNLYAGNVYSVDELISALEGVEKGSLVIVSRFPALPGRSGEGLVEIRRIVDKKGLILVLSHFTFDLNELDLSGEFARLYDLPELFETLAVLRASSYRGHHRLNLTILRAPAEYVAAVGDHSIPADSLVRPFLG